MRDAARQPAHSFHLLRLPELLLQGAPLGHIFGKKLEGSGVPAIRNRASRNADHRSRTVFPFPLHDQSVEWRGGRQIIRQLEPMLRVGVELTEMLPNQFRCRGISEDRQQRWIRIQQ
jgi:hypothetical protein